MLDNILSQVNKPGRYIGQEWNVPRKDFDQAEVKFALCFPDLYEIGMSNLGIRIIYGILNNINDVVCERFFSLWPDMEEALRKNQRAIFSLESKRALKEFDIAGFSLGYELSYTNVLSILSAASIPLEACARDASYPLVIGGGPSTLNPEPMHKFFDFFLIGEAEEAILEIINVYRNAKEKFKSGQVDKEGFLSMFSVIEGVYVPSLYEVSYNSEGRIRDFKPKFKGIPLKVKKRFVKNLDEAYFPLDWLTPNIAIVHDRITLEIMRGCPNTCRFCQAKYQYFPYRQRATKNILSLACAAFKLSGYEDLSLLGLSVSDYPGIIGLMENLIGIFKDKGISVSLPSIKPKAVVGDLASLIATIKKTGLTFAPEAGSVEMRKLLAKDFDLESFDGGIEAAYKAGYQHIKLYFMIGLPYEKEEDLDAIIAFAVRASELRRKVNLGPAGINISINTLIPKPHTPLQWFKMESLEGVKYKQDYLRSKIKNKRIKLDFHNRNMSFLEGVLSRGDRRLSEVIARAFKKGARFDAWGDYFSFGIWHEAFKGCNIDPAFYLNSRLEDEVLPWDFIDIGVSKDILKAEFEKAVAIQRDKE